MALVLLCSLGWFALRSCQARFFKSGQQTQTSSLVSLRSLTPTARQSQLIALISQPERGLSPQQQRDRQRAHYLLAADLVQQGKGKQALGYLQDLSQNYPLLRPQILFKIAQAYRQDNQPQAAEKTLNYLIKNYPNSPLSANALVLLGSKQPRSAQLISQFPNHPLTQNIARQRLRQNPNQYQLLLLLTKSSRAQDLNPIRDRLVLKYSAKLTPDDWQAIADGYWRDEEYRKAADAYIFAPSIPRNLYRAARGFHRNGNLDTAQSAYQQLLGEYHDSQEAGQALIHLASISSGDEAIVYLEKAIAKFPEATPEAYRSKAIVHERFGKYDAANDARQKLLNQYSNSTSAAEYRWQKAQDLAAQGNKQDAWEWMQPVVKSNQEYDAAAQALYTTGKWAMEINQPEAAKTTFQQIIKLYPQSYWAWRAAVMLGWDVGDFNQLRSLAPALDLTKTYEPLPMGSAALQELYFLGQYDDAWLLLQSEIEHPQQTSVNEQFAEGVLLLELGQYSQGMKQIWDLTKRETTQELEQWRALRQTKTYWQSLFPFPYQTQIWQNSQQEKINPLLTISVMRKESTFNPTINSAVGAVGLMQIVPPTAKWTAEQIGLANYSLTNPDDNIKIGTWYLKHNHQRYQDDSLLAVASYNAGTSNVNTWLQQYDIQDRDRFVAQIPFPETKDYIEGVFGNYWNYLRLYNPEIRQKVENLRQQQPPIAKPSK
ncbi:MAG: transglycosylase SLT domain-containing protein [Hyellaceae cyanobacterium CSU_1_1]|nr:transglycosylase SLT domain-containing protein [Hyellaceae cyanobacterium CSU_1_1]